MKAWPIEIQKLFKKIESMKSIDFMIYDAISDGYIYKSPKEKNRLPDVKIIEVRFTL